MLITVWDRNDGEGYGKYRIPGIVATQSGTLIACCEARKERGDWDPMDVVIKRSGDGGLTWSENFIIARGLREGVTCGSPTLIADGELAHLLFCRETGVAARGGGVFHTRSADEGHTWDAPRDISSGTHPAGYARNVLACGPGHGIAHSNGTLICPVWITKGEPGSKLHRPSDIATLYSEDRGETWKIGEVLYSTEDIPNMSEHAPAELSDGRVMLNIRNESPKRRRAVAHSPNGYSDWTQPAHDCALIDPVCFGSLLRYDGRTLLFCNAASESARENITLRMSFDDGQAWPRAVTVNPGPAAYADIAAFGGAAYVLYEMEPNIVLSKIEIGDTRNV